MAGVCDCIGNGGGGGEHKCRAGKQWCVERGAGTERGSESGWGVLQRHLPTRAGAGEDGVLDGAYAVSGDSGESANYAWGGAGRATGVDAIREFGAGGESG